MILVGLLIFALGELAASPKIKYLKFSILFSTVWISIVFHPLMMVCSLKKTLLSLFATKRDTLEEPDGNAPSIEGWIWAAGRTPQL